MLPRLERLLQINVPQLLAIPATEETSPITAYNQDTYMEYHLILSNLLEKFRLALDVLYELEDPHEKAFNDTMDGIVQMGDALQTMVGGSIIEVHMKVITIAHDKSCRIMRDVNKETESKETEQDEELYKISSMLLTWQAYSEWLKLMVVHFDAVHILISFQERVQKPITIKVISTPQPDKSLMPWKKLLENERTSPISSSPPVLSLHSLRSGGMGKRQGTLVSKPLYPTGAA